MKIYKEQNEFTIEEMELVESWVIGEIRDLRSFDQSIPKALGNQLDNVRLWIKEAKKGK